MAAMLATFLTSAPAAYAEPAPLNPNDLLFISSGQWHQFEQDVGDGIFRLYAIAMDAKHEPADMPNLLLLKCREQPPHLVLHFPDTYVFNGFKATDWLPETTLYARNDSSTFRFHAELNRNEIFVDLPGSEENIAALLASTSVEFRFGPNAGDRAVLAMDKSLEQNEKEFLDRDAETSGRGKVVATKDWKAVGPCKPLPASATETPMAAASPPVPPALSEDEAPAQNVLAFRLENGGVSRVAYPSQTVKLGETLSLTELGRRFPDSQVSAAYEQGEDEIEFFKIVNDGAEVELHYDESKKITRIEGRTPGVADEKDAAVGGTVVGALGSRAFCNTFTEDEPVWCKADENANTRYDVAWSDACPMPEQTAGVIDVPACATVAAISVSAPPAPAQQQLEFAAYPAPAFKGKTALPSFKGRDEKYRDYRTRITNSLKEGPNFAGEFSLVQIGCGTGCSFVFVSSNRTGEVLPAPFGGEDTMYLDLLFEKNSRLLAAQWAGYDESTCRIEWFEWTGRALKRLGGSVIGAVDACYKTVGENLGR
ncbi:MAG: hypothetical protein DI629_17790 [Mesorhizobium amorphae]|nr:MAG: hypothetical protein DI629_17790 [Mesorhizobium amorphae]